MQKNKFTFEESFLKNKTFPENLKNWMRSVMRNWEFFLFGLALDVFVPESAGAL
jgi:hypothetical protein